MASGATAEYYNSYSKLHYLTVLFMYDALLLNVANKHVTKQVWFTQATLNEGVVGLERSRRSDADVLFRDSN